MHIGIALGQLGRQADPAAVRACAQAAEGLGYRTVWVVDRLLAPVAPQPENGGVLGGPPPEERTARLDPLATLAFAAACTERVRLGASVSMGAWYSPVELARMLTGIDVLSRGRLTVGLELGRSPTALATAEEATFDVFETIWTDDLEPVQRPRPPILLAAYSPAGLERAARRADGWMPMDVPLDKLATYFASVRDMAAGYGRDPDGLELIVPANVSLVPRTLGPDRPRFHGSVDQVVDDLLAARAAGAHEVFLHVGGDHDLDVSLDAYATLADGLALRTAAA